jgi:hypothetical protein
VQEHQKIEQGHDYQNKVSVEQVEEEDWVCSMASRRSTSSRAAAEWQRFNFGFWEWEHTHLKIKLLCYKVFELSFELVDRAHRRANRAVAIDDDGNWLDDIEISQMTLWRALKPRALPERHKTVIGPPCNQCTYKLQKEVDVGSFLISVLSFPPPRRPCSTSW